MLIRIHYLFFMLFVFLSLGELPFASVKKEAKRGPFSSRKTNQHAQRHHKLSCNGGILSLNHNNDK